MAKRKMTKKQAIQELKNPKKKPVLGAMPSKGTLALTAFAFIAGTQEGKKQAGKKRKRKKSPVVLTAPKARKPRPQK